MRDNVHNPNGRNDVFSDGKVHVMSERCATCIFRPGNLMWLQEGRVKEMVDDSVRAGAAITCHKTMYEEGYDQQAICKGFWDGHATRVPTLRLAIDLGVVEETDGRSEQVREQVQPSEDR